VLSDHTKYRGKFLRVFLRILRLTPLKKRLVFLSGTKNAPRSICSQYVDSTRYKEMLQGELREYDITYIFEEERARREKAEKERKEKRLQAGKKAAETRRPNS